MFLFKSLPLLLLVVAAASGQKKFAGSTAKPPVEVAAPTTTTFAPTTTTATSTTTTTTTTTEAPTTIVVAQVEDATATTEVVTSEDMRVCTCAEVDECNVEAAKKVDTCKDSCKSHLESFGSSVDKYQTCFEDAAEETKKLTKCFENNVEGFCSANATTPKQDYTAYLAWYSVKEDSLTDVPEYQKKAREAFSTIRKFQTCTVGCMKKEAVECYATKKCDIVLPSESDMDAIVESCGNFKTQMHLNSMKSCKCLAFKQEVKKLVGTCAIVANPYMMRAL